MSSSSEVKKKKNRDRAFLMVVPTSSQKHLEALPGNYFAFLRYQAKTHLFTQASNYQLISSFKSTATVFP